MQHACINENLRGMEGGVSLPEMIHLGMASGVCALDCKHHHPQMPPPAQPPRLFRLNQEWEVTYCQVSFFQLSFSLTYSILGKICH